MARHYKTFGASFHIDKDADLIAWLESLPDNARSSAIRDQLRYALRVQGKLPIDYKRGRNIGGAAPEISEVKDRLDELIGLMRNAPQDLTLGQRSDTDDLQARDLGFSDEARESLAARLFGDSDDDEGE